MLHSRTAGTLYVQVSYGHEMRTGGSCHTTGADCIHSQTNH